MHRYDKRVRPNSETDHPVIVHMTIVLGILTEVVSLILEKSKKDYASAGIEPAMFERPPPPRFIAYP